VQELVLCLQTLGLGAGGVHLAFQTLEAN